MNNVNTGAFDPITDIVQSVRNHSSSKVWLHIDGAFGTWAAASPEYRHLTKDFKFADSITLDCHKWLNVPYDSGLVFVRDSEAHLRAMALVAAYYVQSPMGERDNHLWVAEASRRARGFAIYAALRALGRKGVVEIIERCCRLARRMADRLKQDSRVQILNEVVLNQVLVRFLPSDGDENSDKFTAAVMREIQTEGTCWAGGTDWHGRHAMRISVSNWSTTESDIDMSAEAILKCLSATADKPEYSD